MDGKHYQKSISAPSLSRTVPIALEYLILFGIGVVAILLHSRLRIPMNLPGHHGLEFMAILVAGRVASRIPWASSVSSMGIGLILLFPGFGFNDPFMGMNYMFPGFLVDVIYSITRQLPRQWLVMALLSGAAYAMIPLSRLLIQLITGYPYGAFAKYGYLIPFAGFFVFGMAGGFAGAGITSSVLKKIKKKQ